MQNPYEAPKTETTFDSQPPIKFERAQKRLKLAFRIGLLLLITSYIFALMLREHQWASIVSSSLAFTGITLVAISFFSVFPMTIWGFVQGRKDAASAKNSRK